MAMTVDTDSDSVEGYVEWDDDEPDLPPPVLRKAVSDEEDYTSDSSDLLDLPELDENGEMTMSFFERFNIVEKPKQRKRKRSSRNESSVWSFPKLERTLSKPAKASVGSEFSISSLVEKQKRPMKTPKKKNPPRKSASNSTNCEMVEAFDLDDTRKTEDKPISNSTSTFQLIQDSTALMAGINLMNMFSKKKISGEEVRGRLGIKQPRLARSPSPDICSFSSRVKKDKENSAARAKKQIDLEAEATREFNKLKLNFDDENEHESQELDDTTQEKGESILRELVARSQNAELKRELKVEDFDLGDSFKLREELYSDYAKKFELYQQHSKNVMELTVERLTEHFNDIRADLLHICNTDLLSERHNLYVGGPKMRAELIGLNVSVPFDNDQGSSLFYLLYEFLVPDEEERTKCTDYINYVMLPETFIRIYSNINNISLKHAETELRFCACYDGPMFE